MFSSFMSFFSSSAVPQHPATSSSGKGIKITPVPVHAIEISTEKRARTLKHLLKLNHANFSVLYHNKQFHNHMVHILSSAYLLNADVNHLNDIYEEEARTLDPWTDSPGEISLDDWRDYLGQKDYQRAYLDFFEDEVVRRGYDWKAVIYHFLLEGEKPLINCIIGGGLGHPLIHLGYAFEMDSREVGMEALAEAATCYNFSHVYLDDPSYSKPEPSYHSKSLIEILQRVHSDKRFHGLFSTPGADHLSTLFEKAEPALLDHWNAWDLDTTQDPLQRFNESQKAAATLLVGTETRQYDFFLVHLLTTSHALRILLPMLPDGWHVPLVRQWWLVTLALYITQLRPEIKLDRIERYDLNGRDWAWTEKQAIHGKHALDAHYVKAIRALKEAAATWGDEDQFYEKASVRFAAEFNGWNGFG